MCSGLDLVHTDTCMDPHVLCRTSAPCRGWRSPLHGNPPPFSLHPPLRNGNQLPLPSMWVGD